MASNHWHCQARLVPLLFVKAKNRLFRVRPRGFAAHSNAAVLKQADCDVRARKDDF